ncbi:MAX dimerization protein MGA a isoform X2 [Anguilla rostrata]|uniref:MAX dimerization protein MGA a isoform X2 n=1 Tax=Anguilla rostrata TaxID=7938 RepID=UPI0030D30B53
MTATENQALMVLHEEGAAAPAAAPGSAAPPAFFVILKPGQASEGGQDQGILVANQEANLATTSSPTLPGLALPAPCVPSVAGAAKSNTQPDNLPPECTCKGIKVTLDNNNMWNEFYRCRTEMILTKQGRRMFPYCRFRISGMEPFQRYILVMDITPVDNLRYRWTGQQWEVTGKAEPHVLGRVFIHPDSPSSGHYWMQNPISFYKLKLTNNTLDQEGHVILHSKHRYLPRLHVVPADKATEVIQLNGPDVITFTFPQTEFMAVTAYQNLRITQLKIDYNPFAKGFREDSPGHQPLRPRAEPPNASVGPPRFAGDKEDASPLKKSLKSLLLNSTFDNFVMDQELFSSTDYNIGVLDHSISTTNSSEKDISSKKRPQPGPPSEPAPEAKLRTRKGLTERPPSAAGSDKKHAGSASLKEEKEELPVNKATSKESPPDGQEGVGEDQVKTPAGGEPAVAIKPPSDLTPVASSPKLQTSEASGLAVSAGPKGCPAESSGPAAAPLEPGVPALLAEPAARPAKRAERVPLPLLALFLKQRRLKPRAIMPKPETPSDPAPPSPEPAPSSPASTSLPPASGLSSPSPELSSPGPTVPPSVRAQSSPAPEPPSPAPIPLSPTPASSSPAPMETSPAPASLSPAPALWPALPDGPEASEGLDGSDPASGSPGTTQAAAPLSSGKRKRKPKPRSRKHRKHGRRPEADPDEVIGGPTDVSMQPNLEDVEGLLFVSFTSKKALEFHLGDQPLNRELPPAPQKTPEPPVDRETEEEKIARLEIALLHDLKRLKHRQAIHPVLQEVGLKLNLLDHTLPIDLRYLGVCLPLPPPFLYPGGDGSSAGRISSPDGAVHFVSRTGKTTDFTKIKGWREKFNIASDAPPAKPDSSAGVDGALKHRSAFCSDMLDEYLANEGKLIDERAATFAQSAVSPVVYQLPTKSTSYVRTLDSVLKKQTPAPASASASFKPLSPPKRPRPKAPARPKPPKPAPAAPATPDAPAPAPAAGHGAKPAAKAKSSPKGPRAPGPAGDPAGRDPGRASPGQGGASGRGAWLPKTLVKLMDLEDGAVWEGKARTCITQERAEITLASLLTAQGTSKAGPVVARIMKRRAPPCLKAACRLGCVCASLALERRQPTHCGKTECMFGCTCLKHKVVLVREPPKQKKEEGLIFYGALGEDAPPKKKKKKKRMMAYTIPAAEPPSEPAARVRTLWNRKDEDDPEPLHIPEPIHFPSSAAHAPGHDPSASAHRVLKLNAEDEEDRKDPVYLYFESKMTCARVRPYKSKTSPHQAVCPCRSLLCSGKKDDPYHNFPDSTPGKAGVLHTEGAAGKTAKESTLSTPKTAPSKVLEIVSECKWAKKSDRIQVLRVVCEHMAQNRLTHPFRIGPYHIQPLSQSQTRRKGAQGHSVTYKVCISQPAGASPEEGAPDAGGDGSPGDGGPSEGGARVADAPRKTALPFLTGVSPAGILTANRKQPGVPAQGLIKVNGKSYPQAKLQLGQMGALHPANRLAAYITGRLRPLGQEASSAAAAGSKRPSPAASTPQPSHLAKVATTTGVATPAAISSGSAPVAGAVLSSVVTKPTVGKVVTQFVVNKISSLPQRLPSISGPQLVGSVQKLTLSPTQLVVLGSSPPPPSSGVEQGAGAGASITLTMPPGEPPCHVLVPAPSSSTKPLPSTGSSSCTDGNTAPKPPKASPSPGGAAPGPRMLLITVSPPPSGAGPRGPGAGVRGPVPGPRGPAPGARGPAPGIRLAAPSFPPLNPGQRMVLQPVRSASGTTLYRHPNGHLIQLVPLSQLRAAQPNLLIRNPGSVVRLPTPVTSVPDSGSSTPAGPKTSAAAPAGAAVPSATPAQGKPPGDAAPAPAPAPTPKPGPLAGATAIALGGLPPSVKALPGLLGQAGAYAVRISPSAGSKEPKLVALNAAGSSPVSPKVLSVPGGFTLLQLPKSPAGAKPAPLPLYVPLKRGAATEPPPREGKAGRGDPQVTPAGLVCADHSYTSGPGRPEEPQGTEPDRSRVLGSTQEQGGRAGPPGRAGPCEPIAAPSPSELRPTTAPSPARTGTAGDASAVAGALSSGSQAPPKPPSAGAGAGLPGIPDAHRVPGAELNSGPVRGAEASTPPLRGPTDAVQTSAPCRVAKERQPLEEGEVEAEMEVDISGDLPSEDMTEDSEEDSGDNSDDDAVVITSESEGSEEGAAVDIETVEELSEKINIARMKAVAMQKKLERVWSAQEAQRTAEHKASEEQQPEEQEEEEEEEEEEEDDEEGEEAKEEEPSVVGRMQHNVMERRRRSELRGLFLKLQQVLDLQDSPKISKVFILKKATGEIQDLVDQFDHLEERKKILSRQRAAYIRKISQTSGKTEDMIIEKLQDICARQKNLEQKKRKVTKRPAPQPPLVPAVSEGHLPMPRSPGRRPNILSRRKPPAPKTTALPSSVLSLVGGGTLVPGLGAAVPNHPVLTIKGPLQPFATVLRPVSSPDLPAMPGVASVTINVPGMSFPLAVKSPVPEASPAGPSQVISSVTCPTGRNTCALPKIVSAEALVPHTALQEGRGVSAEGSAALPPAPAQDSGLQPAENDKGPSLEDGEVLVDQLTSDRQEDLEAEDDPEDEKLMSLLSEIAFLNQQANSEDAPACHLPEAGPVGGDDERSLSPLFLQLSDDAARPGQPEDEEPSAPQPEEPLAKPPPPEREQQPKPEASASCGAAAAVANGFRQQSPPVSVKGGALTPPPLLQMKSGSVTMATETKKGNGPVPWRPMPRLTPLGLKASSLSQDSAVSAKAPSEPLKQSATPNAAS